MKDRIKDTIKARYGGYHVRKSKSDESKRLIMDGTVPLVVATMRSMDDYIDELENESNECAVSYAVFTTIKGNQFIYWGDLEAEEEYLTKVESK